MDTVFPISADTVVVTSTWVTEDDEAILLVIHEPDGEGGSLWQFHAGNGDYSPSRLQLVRLDTVLTIDPSVAEVADLPIGRTATRSAIGSEWVLSND